ncbi:MAG: hypothetical protein E7678_02840, partial [Ruminococcaceae bacterium]|nr:hypothetical protein [Oscillospiraceae bacterium]
MTVKHKVISAILSAFILVSSLVGCSANESTSDTGESYLQSESMTSSLNVGNFGTEKLENRVTDNLNSNGAYASAPNDNATQNIVSSDNANGGKNVVANNDSKLAPLTLASGSTANYTIVSFFTNSTPLTNINTFASDLKAKTGATFTVSTDTSNIGGKQIVIGYSSNIRPYIGDFAFKSFTGGSAAVVGDTLYIASPTTMRGVLELILDFVVEKVNVSGTTSTIPADFKASADLCAISENLPLFDTSGTASSPESKGTYSAGGGNFQQTYLNLHAADVNNYNNKLKAAGYVLKQSNTINSNQFYTFVKGDTLVHINWFAKLKQYSIIYGPKTYVPATSPITNYQKIATPSISQMALYHTGQS